MNTLFTWYASIQEWLMQELVLPMLYVLGGMGFADDAIGGLDWFMLGVIQVLLIALVLRPLESFWPAEVKASNANQTTSGVIWSDVFYTLIHRLGIFKLALFLLF
jgi:hypothetical protein